MANPVIFEPRTYTMKETAALLGIGISLTYELAHRNELPGIRRIGHRWVVVRRVFDDWLAHGSNGANGHRPEWPAS